VGGHSRPPSRGAGGGTSEEVAVLKAEFGGALARQERTLGQAIEMLHRLTERMDEAASTSAGGSRRRKHKSSLDHYSADLRDGSLTSVANITTATFCSAQPSSHGMTLEDREQDGDRAPRRDRPSRGRRSRHSSSSGSAPIPSAIAAAVEFTRAQSPDRQIYGALHAQRQIPGGSPDDPRLAA